MVALGEGGAFLMSEVLLYVAVVLTAIKISLVARHLAQVSSTWGTSITRNQPPTGPYSRSMPRAMWQS